jgi:HEAT repeat protein
MRHWPLRLKRSAILTNEPVSCCNAGTKRGAALFNLILSDPAQTESIIRFNADWVARSIQERPGEREAIARTLLPVLSLYARDGDYLQAASAATVLSALRHPDSVPPLLDLLSKAGNSLFDASTRIAAFALADLGPEAKQQAVIRLNTGQNWAALRPLFEESADEGQALIAMLEDALSKAESGIATGWIIYRLGALREKRAIAPLVRYLRERPWSNAYTTTESLIQIGGVQVEEAALQLLKHPDESWIRRQATEIVFHLQGKRALPLARRMLTEKDFGVQSSAALYLARHGTPDDLKMLIPRSDFWTGDRVNHYWLMSAITEIRRRHNYDLDGPIKKR